MKTKIRTTIEFELLYHFATTLFFVPLFQQGLLGIMHLAGFEYLTNKNIVAFLLDPIALIALLFLFLVISAYSIIDISGLLLIWNCDEKLNLNTIFSYAFSKIRRVFTPKNGLILVWMLLFLPFLNAGLVSEAVSQIQIPPYLIEYVEKIPFLYSLLLIAFAGLCYVMSRTLFVFPHFILENKTFIASFKASWAQSKHHTLKIFFLFAGVQILYALFSYGLIALLSPLLFQWNLPGKWFLFTLMITFFNSMMLPVNYITISKLYQAEGGKKIHSSVHWETNGQKALYVLIGLVFIGIYGMDTYALIHHPSVLQTQIAAHRGASDRYPENTIAAFLGAKELGADAVELDVQQTKDGVLVISHDSNLKRRGHVDQQIYDAEYKEIQAVDVGDGETLPTLQEVLVLAKKEHLYLIIELKETGHEHDLVQDTVALIQQIQMQNECMITSFDYHLLEEVKERDPQIKTLALFTFAYGNLSSFKDADAFSVEESTITPELVSSIHKEGKQLYAWTPNTKADIDRMLSLGVDGIITDSIEEAKAEIKKKEADPIYNSLPNLF